MAPTTKSSNRRRERLLLVFAMIVALWALLSPSVASEAATQVFYSQLGRADLDGRVLNVEDPALQISITVRRALNGPSDLACASDGGLFVTDLQRPDGSVQVGLGSDGGSVSLGIDDATHRLLRLSVDGSLETVKRWDASRFQPSSLAVASPGRILLGTTSVSDGQPTRGLWELRTPQGADDPELQRLIPPREFLRPVAGTSLSVRPLGFLSEGPHAGDLLVIDTPVQSLVPGGRVLRVTGPEFSRAEPFIEPFVDVDTDLPFKPAGLAVLPDGDVLVSDFTNDKLWRFRPDGTRVATFAEVTGPNQLAVAPSGHVYATTVSAVGPTVQGSLFAWNAVGELLWRIRAQGVPRGVAACPSSP